MFESRERPHRSPARLRRNSSYFSTQRLEGTILPEIECEALAQNVILGPLAILEYNGTPPAGCEALSFFGMMAIIFAPICVFGALSVVGERKTASAPRIGLVQGLSFVLRNPHMRRLLLADAMASIPGAVMSGLFIFYQAELLGNVQFNSLGLIAFFLAEVAFFIPRSDGRRRGGL
ncbi:MAG: MFS transporter [Gammaproteobacteria bacterium]|nr:MFS transporter [Gammaproteobacteria bacterium]